MMQKTYYLLIALLASLFTPTLMAHPGQHGEHHLLIDLLHQLSSADHLLMVLAFTLLIGSFLVSIRRH